VRVRVARRVKPVADRATPTVKGAVVEFKIQTYFLMCRFTIRSIISGLAYALFRYKITFGSFPKWASQVSSSASYSSVVA